MGNSYAWRRRVCRALYFRKAIISIITLFIMVAPSFAGAPDCTACDPIAQTAALRHRLESMRNWNRRVSVSFIPHKAYLVGITESTLRLGGCTYDVDKDMSGLIDILLGAQIKAGYPAGWEKYQPEARFGVYIGVDSADGVDL